MWWRIKVDTISHRIPPSLLKNMNKWLRNWTFCHEIRFWPTGSHVHYLGHTSIKYVNKRASVKTLLLHRWNRGSRLIYGSLQWVFTFTNIIMRLQNMSVLYTVITLLCFRVYFNTWAYPLEYFEHNLHKYGFDYKL